MKNVMIRPKTFLTKDIKIDDFDQIVWTLTSMREAQTLTDFKNIFCTVFVLPGSTFWALLRFEY